MSIKQKRQQYVVINVFDLKPDSIYIYIYIYNFNIYIDLAKLLIDEIEPT